MTNRLRVTTKFFFIVLSGVTLISLAALGLISTTTNPFRATTLQLFFFYSSLFFVFASTFSIIALVVLRHFDVAASQLQTVALREGAIVGGLVVSLLLLQSYDLLTFPVILALMAIVGFIELFAAFTVRHEVKNAELLRKNNHDIKGN